ncbi:MAG: Gfo/Idh/MocA family protein [Peptostreptococcaceae bacterium]
MKLRVGVIGLGDVSIVHTNAIKLSDKADLVAVCDTDETKKDLVENTNFYTDYNEMIEKENLDCVHICLPHYLHYPVTKEITSNFKKINVLLEKPLCLNVEEVEKFNELDKETDANICICLQNRYNHTVKTLLEIIESKQYGNVKAIKGIVAWNRPEAYYTVKPWRGKMEYAGGGVMINQAVHTIDLMQLFGGEIESIKGNISNLLDYDIEVEDTAMANINFKNGSRGTFISTISYADNSSVEIEVILDDARFVIKDSILYKNNNGTQEEVAKDKLFEGAKHYYGSSHAELISDYYDCLINNTKGYISVSDASNSIKMIESIRNSSKENKLINWGN